MRPEAALALSAALAALWNSAAEARFAPPVDKPIRQIVTEERRNGAQVQQFTIERRLTFRAMPAGYVLELVTEQIGDRRQVATAMFAAGMAGLVGRTLRYQMNADGIVTGIDDQAAIWAAICDSIDRMAQGAPALRTRRKSSTRSMSATLRALPPARQRAMLTSIVASIIAGPLAEKEPGDDRTVSAPGQSPAGLAMLLAGRERVRQSPDALGQTIVETDMEGDFRPPPGTSLPPAHITLRAQQRVDRATGLIVDHQQSRVTTIEGDQNAQSISTTRMQLKPTVF